MSRTRRIGFLAAAAVAAIGMTVTAGAAPAAAARKASGPKPVNQLLPRVDDGESTWVNVWFRTDKKACDFRLSVWDNNRVGIYHPMGSFTSLEDNSTLSRYEQDYASFRVDVDEVDRDRTTLLFARISWKWCGSGKWQSKTTGFLLPIND